MRLSKWPWLRRWQCRMWLFFNTEDQYNRRTYVERRLRDAARGARSLPTAEECREWGNKLSIPSEFRLGGKK